MRILLATHGSLGDIKPFASLARALVAAGHEVHAISSNVYESIFKDTGASFSAVGPRASHQPHEARSLSRKLRRASPRRQIELVIAHLQLRDVGTLADQVRQAATGCDVGVCHAAAFVAQRVLAVAGIPWASTFFYPGAVPAPHQPRLELPNLGWFGNRLVAAAIGCYLRPVRRRVEHALDQLEPPVQATSHRRVDHSVRPLGSASPTLNLLAFSRYLGPMSHRWPTPAEITGPWLDPHRAYQPDPTLQTFLESQRPQVAVSFGSMGGQAEETVGLLLAGLARAGLRAVIQRGWAGLAHEEPPEDILFTDYVPHSYLFGQVPIVVHHGGAGTTAAASQAGAVSVVVPHAGDQGGWGRRLHALGTAPRPIPRQRLTAEALAAALTAAQAEPMAQRAREIARKMVAEPGPSAAVLALERVAHESPRSPRARRS